MGRNQSKVQESIALEICKFNLNWGWEYWQKRGLNSSQQQQLYPYDSVLFGWNFGIIT